MKNRNTILEQGKIRDHAESSAHFQMALKCYKNAEEINKTLNTHRREIFLNLALFYNELDGQVDKRTLLKFLRETFGKHIENSSLKKLSKVAVLVKNHGKDCFSHYSILNLCALSEYDTKKVSEILAKEATATAAEKIGNMPNKDFKIEASAEAGVEKSENIPSSCGRRNSTSNQMGPEEELLKLLDEATNLIQNAITFVKYIETLPEEVPKKVKSILNQNGILMSLVDKHNSANIKGAAHDSSEKSSGHSIQSNH